MAYKIAYGDVVPNVTTWEWNSVYSLRNVIFPAYLSIPLHLLRLLGLDSNFMVVNSTIFMNSLLQVLGDYFLFQLSDHLIGKEGACISLTYVLFNQRINEVGQKTLSNGAEAVFSIGGLNYFAKLKPKLDYNMAMMTFCITIAFLVRSSNLVGWVPLALYKMF
jgi:hypothetical protein